MNRRIFMALSALTASLPAFPISKKARLPRNVLVLGGTNFFGPVIVRQLVEQGHSVTLFNRGITNPHLFPELPLIKGDRETSDGSGLQQLRANTQDWDWVVDTWQGSSKAVENTALLLRERTKQYQYVSTVSVYDKWDQIGISESAALNPLPSEPEPILSSNRYAIRKTLSEEVLRRLMPDNSVMFRSHGMRGYANSAAKHEPYWQVKIARQKHLVLPSDAEYYQVTDMISLARFMIHAATHKLSGAYNVAYPPALFRSFINDIVEELDSKVLLHWVPQQFLLKENAKLIRTLPEGRYRFDVSRALQGGLVNRSYTELLNDQLRGYRDRNPNDNFKFGMPDTSTISVIEEQRIIELWQKHISNSKPL